MRALFFIFLSIFSFSARAQMPVMKIKDPKMAQNVVLEKLDVSVSIVGNIATTNMTMSFRNKGSRILEGELSFPMPEGVTVSRYALDINGKMREAVPVEKAKATEVFESIEHRNVDPGLLEKVEGNNFRTRIYPLPVGGLRTVTIGYEEELKYNKGNTLRYHLPLDFKHSIPQFSLSTTVISSLEMPLLEEQPDGSFSFEHKGSTYFASMKRSDFQPRKSLTINLPKTAETSEIVCQRNTNGSSYFLINDYPVAQSRDKIWGNRIGVLWDVSFSGLQRDTKKELELLGKIITQKQNLSIELAFLNHKFRKGGTFVIQNGNWQTLRKKLESVIYDGATDYSLLNLPDFVSTLAASSLNEILFFTEGLSTFGPNTIHLKCPIHTINSATKADFSTLKLICATNGGSFINLNNQSVDEAFLMLGKEHLQFLGIERNAGISEVYPGIPTEISGHISVAGLMNAGVSKLTLLYGFNGKIVQRRTINVPIENEANIPVQRIWAQKKIAEMDVNYDRHKKEIAALAGQFGIVTRNTSLMVLEDVNDYVRYGIRPPTELLPEYNRLTKLQLAAKEQRVNDLLQQAFAMTNDLKKWWRTKFIPNQSEPYQQAERYPMPAAADDAPPSSGAYTNVITQTGDANGIDLSIVDNPGKGNATITEEPSSPSVRRGEEGPANVPPPFPNLRKDEESRPMPAAANSTGYSRVESIEINRSPSNNILSLSSGSYTAPSNISNTPNTMQWSGTQNFTVNYTQPGTLQYNATAPQNIIIPEFKSDKEYILKLKDKKVKDAYLFYLSLRKDYLDVPTFYYDMARWFFQNKSKDTGLMILSNIAEMDLENAELYKMMAYQLKQNGYYQKELWVNQKVLEWRPMDPQSVRDYALALADNKQYQKALDTLYSILLKSYSPEAAGRDDGIEEVIVMEINQLISLHKSALNLSKIDKRIIANLPVDIRVVLNWNKMDTDIDLWVTAPNGEKCYYSQPTTSAGGRISNDFTQGFGPEQFMLHRAIKGNYKIQTNFFGENQLSISGPTTLMAEIYFHYADGRQTRKVICLQSGEAGREEDGVTIGEFTF